MSVSFYAGIRTGSNKIDYIEGGPEITLANTNASAILQLLGFYDVWDSPAVPLQEFQSRVFKALNSGKAKGFVRDTYETEAASGARIVSVGITEEYILEKLESLLEFCRWGRMNDAEYIYWG